MPAAKPLSKLQGLLKKPGPDALVPAVRSHDEFRDLRYGSCIAKLALDPQVQHPFDPAIFLINQTVIMLPVLQLLIQDIVELFPGELKSLLAADQTADGIAIG